MRALPGTLAMVADALDHLWVLEIGTDCLLVVAYDVDGAEIVRVLRLHRPPD